MKDKKNELEIIKELEKIAKEILDKKKKVMPRRPVVIECSGIPKSGKTSSINSLDIFLRRNNFKTKVLTERASVCPIENKFDPLFNVWTANASLNQLIEIISNNPKKYDVIIMDRGLFDALCWFTWQFENNFIDKENYNRFFKFFTSPRFNMMIDIIIHFDCSPETSMEREYKNLLTRKKGSVMREVVLEGYRKAAKVVNERYSKIFRKVTILNTDNLTQNESAEKVTRICLEQLEELFMEKIGYINKKDVLEFFKRDVFDLDEIGNINISFMKREEVENDNEKVQLVPCAVITNHDMSKVLIARKGKTATSHDSPEKGKLLLYFGGHIREEDRLVFKDGNAYDIIRQCLFREIKEELGIDVYPMHPPICVWVKDNKKSEKHIAIIHVIKRDLENIRITIDENEFVKRTKKRGGGTGDIVEVSKISKRLSSLDSWSKIILREIFGIKDLIL